jgi:hypothetical protein
MSILKYCTWQTDCPSIPTKTNMFRTPQGWWFVTALKFVRGESQGPLSLHSSSRDSRNNSSVKYDLNMFDRLVLTATLLLRPPKPERLPQRRASPSPSKIRESRIVRKATKKMLDRRSLRNILTTSFLHQFDDINIKKQRFENREECGRRRKVWEEFRHHGGDQQCRGSNGHPMVDFR